MTKIIYDKKNKAYPYWKSVVFIIVTGVITYLFSKTEIFTYDLSLAVSFCVGMIFTDRRFIYIPLCMFISVLTKGDMVYNVMAAMYVFGIVSFGMIIKSCSRVMICGISSVVIMAGNLLTYRFFALEDSFILNSAVSALSAFLLTDVFATTSGIVNTGRNLTRMSIREELSVIIALGLAVISTENIIHGRINIPEMIMAAIVITIPEILPQKSMKTAFVFSVLSVIILKRNPQVIIIFTSLAYLSEMLAGKKNLIYSVFLPVGVMGLCTLLKIPPGRYMWEIGTGVIFSLMARKYISRKYPPDIKAFHNPEVFLTKSVGGILSKEIEANKAALKCLSENTAEESPESDIFKDIARVVVTRVCMKCDNYPSCWLEDGEKTFSVFREGISKVMYDNGKNAVFCTHCGEEKNKDLVVAAEYSYTVLRSQQDYKSRISRFLRIYRFQINYLCSMLDKINNTITGNFGSDKISSAELRETFRENGIDISDVVISTDTCGDMKAVIFSDIPFGENTLKRDIRNILGGFMKKNFLYSYCDNSNEGKYLYVYEEDYERSLKYAFAARTKAGEELSGDSILLRDFSYRQLIAICDGMGSGKAAAAQSRKVSKMLEKLLTAGYDYENAVEIINCSLSLGEDSEVFSTLDMLLYDRRTSEAVFLKAGAESGYIKRNDEIIKIKSETLPIGILESTHTDAVKITLQKGDYVYLFSDGLVSMMEYNEEYIKTLIMKNSFRYPKKVADSIMDTVLSLNGGVAADDISVIVCKVR